MERIGYKERSQRPLYTAYERSHEACGCRCTQKINPLVAKLLFELEAKESFFNIIDEQLSADQRTLCETQFECFRWAFFEDYSRVSSTRRIKIGRIVWRAENPVC